MNVICITLPEFPKRRIEAEAHFRHIGLEGVRMVDGIYAEGFGLLTAHPYEINDPGSQMLIGYRRTGCFLSHFIAWTLALQLPDDITLILEDDCEFAPNWKERLAKIQADLPPDWDIVYLGSSNTADKPKEQFTGDLWVVKYPMSTHCMMLRRKAAAVLLATNRDCWAPVDIAIMIRSLPLLKTFTVLPRMASQRGMVLPE